MTLYRQYRPQRFSDLLGQHAVSTTLQQALAQGRVAHAYLFSGGRGTGKTSTARIFAKALVCQHPIREAVDLTVRYEACGECGSCQAVASGHSPDLIEIDAASNRGIEDIRELREQTHYPPLQLSRKIYIIDEVHMLTGEAFNALLKTLEEPPEHCLFILATTELHKVPLTIRSRCQLVRFERGNVESIKQKLDSIISQEKWSVADGVTQLLAEHADGGFRDAETLLESLATQHTNLTLEAAQSTLGVLQKDQVDSLLQSSLEGNGPEVRRLLAELSELQSGSLERVIAQLINRLRQALFVQETGAATQQPFLTYATSLPLGKLAMALDRLLEAYLLQRGSPIPSLTLEIACLSIAQDTQPPLSAAQPVRPAIQRIAVTPPPPQPEAEIAPAPEPEARPAAIPNTAPIVLNEPVITPAQSVPVVELRQETVKDVRKAWKLMTDRICTENLALGQALKQTLVHTVEDDTIVIYVRFKFHADKLNEKKNDAQIKAVLTDLTDKDWKISYTVTSATPRQKHTKALPDGIEDVAAVFGKSE